jgi:outer membrane protein OmpA-like peptidoglycan-associated protein
VADGGCRPQKLCGTHAARAKTRMRHWQLIVLSLTLLLSVSPAVQSGWQQPGAIEQPHGKMATSRPDSTAHGTLANAGRTPGSKGHPGIKQERSHCQSRIAVGADALFDFNQSNLRPDATQTLEALGPVIRNYGTHPLEIDGHTDAIGSLSYNQELSEARAQTVKDWLMAHGYVPASAPIKGYGKTHPIAPNTNADGSDNAVGRQKNRRVEIVIDTCK